MKVLIMGGGPAGLSCAALLGEMGRPCEITVLERQAAEEEAGWGITLRTKGLSFLGLDGMLPMRSLTGRAFWYRGEREIDLPNPPGVALATVSRAALTGALLRRARAVGARVRFGADASDLREPQLAEYDLVVAADGANSTLRRMYADAFGPTEVVGANQFAWLASDAAFDRLSILVDDRDTPLLAWGYRYAEKLSTFIIELSEDTLRDSGFGRRGADDVCRVIAGIFARELGGGSVLWQGPSIREASPRRTIRWQTFSTISCKTLHHRNMVLIGDAAHTTHFSQGFGTIFAFDDALALKSAIEKAKTIEAALEDYQATQRPKIAAFQETASTSMRWAEAVTRAADRRDEKELRGLMAARWPNNEAPPGPLGGPVPNR